MYMWEIQLLDTGRSSWRLLYKDVLSKGRGQRGRCIHAYSNSDTSDERREEGSLSPYDCMHSMSVRSKTIWSSLSLLFQQSTRNSATYAMVSSMRMGKMDSKRTMRDKRFIHSLQYSSIKLWCNYRSFSLYDLNEAGGVVYMLWQEN